MADEPDDMTIDELARTAGVVASTVRLYQSRGLLDPPTRRGRVGYYADGHLVRLRTITGLQQRGFSLAAIKELLDGLDRGDSLTAVLGLGVRPATPRPGIPPAGPEAAEATWAPEQPEVLTPAELADALPQVELTPEVVGRVVALGLVTLRDDGRVVVPSPSFLRIGAELAALGLPAEVILDQYDALRADAARLADRFTEVFRRYLWQPFAEAGMPATRTAELVAALEALGPLAEGVVVTSLRHALRASADTFVRTEAARLAIPIPRPGDPHGPE